MMLHRTRRLAALPALRALRDWPAAKDSKRSPDI
jgi:hypothetical protein